MSPGRGLLYEDNHVPRELMLFESGPVLSVRSAYTPGKRGRPQASRQPQKMRAGIHAPKHPLRRDRLAQADLIDLVDGRCAIAPDLLTAEYV